MRCGLLGRTLSHSYSPLIHRYLGADSYELFPREPEEWESFVRSGDFDGINVTIPYKKSVAALCDQLSPIAKRVGCVNTVVRNSERLLVGHNTDYFGFRSLLEHYGILPHGKKVLVLGSGGASGAVCAVLEDCGAAVTVISRRGENNYGNIRMHGDASLIVNCTPVGMYPDTGESLVDLSLFPDLEAVIDLIYNPARTRLLIDAENAGIPGTNGLWMLCAQAKESAQWFQGKTIPDEKIGSVYREVKMRQENLILIGMPGCGKTTVGKILAERLCRPFADADEAFAEKFGISPACCIEKYGEAHFREMETQILSHLGKRSGLVIATGGGCVTREENYFHLRQNGTIFLLRRDPDLLPTDGRPISRRDGIRDLEAERKEKYIRFAHRVIENDGTAEQAADRIIKEFKP